MMKPIVKAARPPAVTSTRVQPRQLARDQEIASVAAQGIVTRTKEILKQQAKRRQLKPIPKPSFMTCKRVSKPLPIGSKTIMKEEPESENDEPKLPQLANGSMQSNTSIKSENVETHDGMCNSNVDQDTDEAVENAADRYDVQKTLAFEATDTNVAQKNTKIQETTGKGPKNDTDCFTACIDSLHRGALVLAGTDPDAEKTSVKDEEKTSDAEETSVEQNIDKKNQGHGPMPSQSHDEKCLGSKHPRVIHMNDAEVSEEL
eukprot:12409241-Karenia_brevis.AAC.1